MRQTLRWFDPMRLVALHRTWLFRASAQCGPGFKATERAMLFPHKAPREAINLGEHAVIDGTIEVYDRGQLNIGSHFFLGRSRIYCAHEVTIGDFVLISDGVAVMDSDLHPRKASRRQAIAAAWARGVFPDVYEDTPGGAVRIDSKAWIGFGASVLKGVTIGEGAIVGAGSIVSSDVPPWTIVAGAPARVIRELGADER